MISVISHGGEGGTLFSHWLFLIPPPRVGYVIDVIVLLVVFIEKSLYCSILCISCIKVILNITRNVDVW